MQSVSDFYDRLAPDYDAMTGFEERFVKERPFFHLIVKRYGIHSALDAGSGTGFHSLLLARLGVEVTAVDVSRRMLDRLVGHATALDLSVEAVESSFQSLEEIVTKRFDAVLCLGNALAHLVSDDELSRALASFWRLLKPDGHLVAQLLNYDKILGRGERIQSVKEANGKTFVRFYDFDGGEKIRFNILTLAKTGGEISHSMITTELRAVRKDTIVRALKEIGFGTIEIFGGIDLSKFNPHASHDLVIIARKNI